jgi:hypothetical protein
VGVLAARLEGVRRRVTRNHQDVIAQTSRRHTMEIMIA